MKNTNELLKIHNGDIKITKENQESWIKKLEYIEIINGSVDVYQNAKASFPKLKNVSGPVYVYENAKVSFPNLKQSSYVDVCENAKASFPKLKSVSGYVYVCENAKVSFPKLESVSGFVDVRNGDIKLEKQLWKIASKNQWYVSEKSSEWLLSQKGKFIYQLNGIRFEKEWFDKIRKDQLSPEEIFAIDNTEHRRVAYEFMDKRKMKQLKDYKVLDEKTDEKGNPMKILSFTIQNMKEPLKFYNCLCPSSKREYFLQTDKDTCNEAKAGMFGFKAEEAEFVEEW